MSPILKTICQFLGNCTFDAPRKADIFERDAANPVGMGTFCPITETVDRCVVTKWNSTNPWSYTRKPDRYIPWEWKGKIRATKITKKNTPNASRHLCLYDGSALENPGQPIGTAGCWYYDVDKLAGPQLAIDWTVEGNLWIYTDENAGAVFHPVFVGTFKNAFTLRCLTFKRDGGYRESEDESTMVLGGIISEPCNDQDPDQNFVMFMWKNDYVHSIIPFNDNWVTNCREPLYDGTQRSHRSIQAFDNPSLVPFGCGKTGWEFFPGFFRANGPHKSPRITEDTDPWYPAWGKDRAVDPNYIYDIQVT